MKIVQIRQPDVQDEEFTIQCWADTAFQPERKLQQLADYHGQEYRLVEVLDSVVPKKVEELS